MSGSQTRSCAAKTESSQTSVTAGDDGRAALKWSKRNDRTDWAVLSEGCYLLRSNVDDWSGEKLWKAGQRRRAWGNSIPTLLEEFARIQSTDIVLPVRDGRSVRLRCIVRPDRAQSILLDHLGLILPERLKIPKGMHKCSADFS